MKFYDEPYETTWKRKSYQEWKRHKNKPGERYVVCSECGHWFWYKATRHKQKLRCPGCHSTITVGGKKSQVHEPEKHKLSLGEALLYLFVLGMVGISIMILVGGA